MSHEAGVTGTRNAGLRRTAEGSRSRVEELHRQLATGIEALQSGEGWRRMLDFTSRFHRYSLRNQILIGLAHEAAHRAGLVTSPTPSYVAGFHTWKTLGRRVDKGQKGYPILAPTPFEVRVAIIGEGARTARRLLGKGEEPRAGERVEVQRRTGWKIEHVFDVSQTSGTPLPEVQRPQPLTGDAPDGVTAGLIECATELGFRVVLTADRAKLHGADGLTNFRDSTILVREDMQPAAIASTLAHEVGHVLLHDPTTNPATIATHRGVGEWRPNRWPTSSRPHMGWTPRSTASRTWPAGRTAARLWRSSRPRRSGS